MISWAETSRDPLQEIARARKSFLLLTQMKGTPIQCHYAMQNNLASKKKASYIVEIGM